MRRLMRSAKRSVYHCGIRLTDRKRRRPVRSRADGAPPLFAPIANVNLVGQHQTLPAANPQTPSASLIVQEDFVVSLLPTQQIPHQQIAGVYHRRIGDIVVTSISDGYLDGTLDVMKNVDIDKARAILFGQRAR